MWGRGDGTHRDSRAEQGVNLGRKRCATSARASTWLVLRSHLLRSHSEIEPHPLTSLCRFGLDLKRHGSQILGGLHESTDLAVHPNVRGVLCSQRIRVSA